MRFSNGLTITLETYITEHIQKKQDYKVRTDRGHKLNHMTCKMIFVSAKYGFDEV